ncbi:MAG: 3-deoxy-8-phosphooctulonate synthase [SAR86 cluster bacterium]|uniref:3-deoxy-8-phosphooctulonate synthase n=1 Tax=SAR86 cluster bacterium TaxID=2030880 RepID=A0A368BS22_9GAMM|nr:MAG: 3-deoxy-8-phosphooctulonate synthase [SAR86 cluster bacterium]
MSIQLNGFEIGNDSPLTVMGGVNVLENEDLVMRVAESFKEATEKNKINWIFKGSFDKANRSSIDSFRGPGLEEGLEILQKVKEHFNVPIITDIHEPDQAVPVSKVADIIQIPAFLCRQTDLVIAAAKTGAVIQFKKPQFLSAIEMQNVAKKCESAGNSKILMCERGNAFGYNNLIVDMLNFQVLKDIDYPVIFDVTHSLQLPGGLGNAAGGRRDLFLPLAKSGLAQKIAGLFIEAHINPDEAKCDGPCAINTQKIGPYLSELKALDNLIKDQLSR